MKEDFLHFLWKFGLFEKENASTTTGEALEIISAGQHNMDAGPDFFNAKISIGKTLWAGNVEVHHRASDWEQHAHHNNKAYDNVILHVVSENDKPVFRSTGEPIPTFILRYDKTIEQRYGDLLDSTDWISCQSYIKNIDLFRIKHFLGRILVERLEQRNTHITSILQKTQDNWHGAFHQLLFRAFGFGVNALPFELLAKATPYNMLAKHRHSLCQIEAILFGQAGFLEGPSPDDYHASLQKEYQFLQAKFSLHPVETHLWKFLRIRPSNFPTVRIAQLAQLLHSSSGLLDNLLVCRTAGEIYNLFSVQASEYWDTHYLFGKETIKKPKLLGTSSMQRIIMNAVVPFLFSYGRYHGNEEVCDTAINLLETLPPEKNHITEGWRSIGINPENAFYTQALQQLKTAYCDKKNCLSCSIGTAQLTKL